MCGINGFSWSDEELIKRMNFAIRHRGPDGEGVYVDDNVSLGHVRLAIIDLSPRGRQPMKYERDGREVWIVYNGEVYNFMEIRRELEEKGYTFNSNTDTEVILASYLEWGFDCVEKFNGMWAFAIYDKSENILFLSRDRFGIKPLYYYYDDKNIIFSSEIKGILVHDIPKEINKGKISQYFMFRGILGEDTLFKNVKKVLPAHNLVFDLNSRKIKTWRYWILKSRPEYERLSFEKAQRKLDELLKKSVKRRLIADVKVGAILSGGLDSSVVTAYMRDLSDKVITFTVRFRSNKFDEGVFARKVAEHLNAEHYEITLDFEDFIKGMEEYAQIKDEPIGVPNEVALYILSKHIRKLGVYVVLSGEGSDEIFYGYSRIFRTPFDLERMRIFLNEECPEDAFREYLPELYRKYEGRLVTTLLELLKIRYPYWPLEVLKQILGPLMDESYLSHFQEVLDELPYDDYHKLSYFFLKVHLPILLSRVDNSTMANAVESRVPFLDHELVEFVFSLPNHYKNPWKSWNDYIEALPKTSDQIAEIHDIPKYILKKIAKGKIPDEIIKRKKMGFPVPFVEWKDRLLEYAKDLLLTDDSKILAYMSKDSVEKLIQQSQKVDDNYAIQRIWMLISFELWLRNWGD